jgi:carbamoyl-phosphate synthase small subunit
MTITQQQKAAIVLADGKVFSGYGFGALVTSADPVIGEAVFNTSLYGYQEILTDPSYAGQIMCFTYPHIGNVGVNPEDVESRHMHVEGVIVRNVSLRPSNFRSTQSFPEYLAQNGKFGLSGVDTRALVKYLRDQGAQMGAMSLVSNEQDLNLLQEAAKRAGSMEGKDYVRQVSCQSGYEWNEGTWRGPLQGYQQSSHTDLAKASHVVVLDCGVKENILRMLVDAGFRLTVLPATSTTAEIESVRPDALFLSNGPGDPATLGYIISAIKPFIGNIPIFGICLGHQILGQAFGGKTYKLKFGHRGGNHPVKDLQTGKVEITVQNHGFAVDASTLPPHVKVSHVNLNDGTVEGISCAEQKVFSVQYHPESSSGPHDSRYLFERFAGLVRGEAVL